MKHAYIFCVSLWKEVQNDDLIHLANELTYKLLLALFPFVIFAISLIGFFNLDGNYLIAELIGALPDQVMSILIVFIREVVNEKSPGILSTSLLVSVISASSGFNAMIRGINKTYGCKETRNIVVVRIVSILLTLVFAVILGCYVMLIILNHWLKDMLEQQLPAGISSLVFGITGYFLSVGVLLVIVMVIYKLSACIKVKLREVIPGAFTTVLIWSVASKGFNIYITNFSRYSTVYGSIGSVFILMFWLNIISIALLLGSEVNAMLRGEV